MEDLSEAQMLDKIDRLAAQLKDGKGSTIHNIVTSIRVNGTISLSNQQSLSPVKEETSFLDMLTEKEQHNTNNVQSQALLSYANLNFLSKPQILDDEEEDFLFDDDRDDDDRVAGFISREDKGRPQTLADKEEDFVVDDDKDDDAIVPGFAYSKDEGTKDIIGFIQLKDNEEELIDESEELIIYRKDLNILVDVNILKLRIYKAVSADPREVRLKSQVIITKTEDMPRNSEEKRVVGIITHKDLLLVITYQTCDSTYENCFRLFRLTKNGTQEAELVDDNYFMATDKKKWGGEPYHIYDNAGLKVTFGDKATKEAEQDGFDEETDPYFDVKYDDKQSRIYYTFEG